MTDDSAEVAASDRLPLSALVSSRNEASLLPRCLARSRSATRSSSSTWTPRTKRRNAAAHGAQVVLHPYVPIAEAARVTVAPQARHDWLLVVDPDEEVTPALADRGRRDPADARRGRRGGRRASPVLLRRATSSRNGLGRPEQASPARPPRPRRAHAGRSGAGCASCPATE